MTEPIDNPSPASTPVEAAPAPMLAYGAEPTYVPSGYATGGGLLVALGGGLLTAAIGAALGLAWLLSKLPNFLILPSIAQGLLVGVVLLRLLRRGKVRNPAAAIVVGVCCGLASAAFFSAMLYGRAVYLTRVELHRLAQGPGPGQRFFVAAATRADSHPFEVYDAAALQGRTTHHGLLGFFIMKGTALWIVAGVQAGIVALFAAVLGKASATRPFCEICGTWCKAPYNVAVLPAFYAQPLSKAIVSADVQHVLTLHDHAAGRALGTSCAVARVHACPRCGQKFADVVVKSARRNNVVLLRPQRVSQEMVEALKYEPEEAPTLAPAVSDATASPPTDSSTENG